MVVNGILMVIRIAIVVIIIIVAIITTTVIIAAIPHIPSSIITATIISVCSQLLK